ncbi:hypothetical protein ACH5RR_007178 [Cinchona calisaya]|uniref:Uncharacterized protein n=1 Tax=Cinchona calisaya TaxID=153742 RepID=A0ABD3AR13_9GENT
MGQCASSTSSVPDLGLAFVLEEVEERLTELKSQIENREFFRLSVSLEQPNVSMLSTLSNQIKTFQLELGFLKMFLGMVDKLIKGTRVELSLTSLSHIKEATDGIAREFLVITGRKLEKNVSKPITLFTNLLEKVEYLKPYVEECCDYLLMQNFLVVERDPFWDDHDGYWYGFLESIQVNLQILWMEKADLHQEIDHLPLVEKIKAFMDRLSYLTDFFVSISESWTSMHITFLRKYALGLAIRAAILSCLCWIRRSKIDQYMAGEMVSAFSDLQQKLDPASLKFLYMIIRFLGIVRQKGATTYPVNMFMLHILRIKREYREKLKISEFIDREHPFFLEMGDFIKYFIQVREEHEKDVELLLPDMAAMIRQAGSVEVQDSLRKGGVGGGGPADLVHFKLVALLRLLRAEIFIIDVLNNREFFLTEVPNDNREDLNLDLPKKRTSRFSFRDVPSLDKIARGQVKFLHLHSKSIHHKSPDPPEDNMEFWKQVFLLSGEVAKKLEVLPNSFNAGKITRYEVRNVLLKWLISILVFKAEAYLMDLLNSNENLILLVKDQIVYLKSLVASITNMPKKLIFLDLEKVTKDEILMLMLTESVARQVLSLYHSFHAGQFTAGTMELSNQLSGLIENTKQVIYEIDVQLPHIRFPKTNGLGFVDFLLMKLREFLKYKSGSIFVTQHKREILKYESVWIAFVREHIEVILTNLGFLRSFLGEQNNKHHKFKELGILVRDAAYRVELIIDSIVLANGSQRKNLSWLYHVSENIGHIKMKVTEFKEKACNVGVRNGFQTMRCEISEASTFEIDEENDQEQVVVDELTRESLLRDMGHQISQTCAFEIDEDVVVPNNQHQVIVDQLARGPSYKDMGREIPETCTFEEITEDVLILNDHQEVTFDQRGLSNRDMRSEIIRTSTFEINEDMEVLNDQEQMIVDRLNRGSSQRHLERVGRENSQPSTFESDEDVMVLDDQQKGMVDQLTRGSSQRDMGFQISQTSTFEINEDVVVLNDQLEVIVVRLTRGSLQRDIVSIVGMPGIGKTTLANRVYHNPEVVYYFHIHAWCCVSQVYTKRDLLIEILRQIIELTDSILIMTDEDLEFVLYKHLKRRRYLIFMDDVWDIRVWDDLKSSFPDDGNGSRILITSRLHDAVSKVTVESNLLDLRPLSDDESWKLLKMKIFSKEGCPEELLEVGNEIARNCKGLPLSIVAVAGLLQGTHMKPDSWKQIAESLNSILVVDPQIRCMDILELSYKHLPDYLKACFLYFGVFQEDKEIPVRRLIWLWMAEGFVLKRDSKSLEDLAEDYLRDLIGRSLITIAKRRSNGGVKACRMHDMVRNLCMLKAKEEIFLQLVTGNNEPYASFDDSIDFDDFDPSNSMTYEQYRLCISTSREKFVMSRPSGPYVRSLLFFATTDTYPRCPYNVSFISENFKLLKVLDLESINMGSSYADGINLLVQLSYLAVSGDIDSLPSSLANLRNLETLLVKGLKGKVILPDSIWSMTRLRHVHINNHAVFTLKYIRTGSYYPLSNLVSLSMPSLSYGEHAELIIMRLPNLRKLSCIFSKSRDYFTQGNQYPRLEYLTQLESLKVVYRGRTVNTGEFNFPSSLKQLSLVNFFLRWDHISTIGRFENLEVLKLLSSTFEDEIWEMREGEFPELKFLKLDSLNIVEWNASCSHLPNLQQLVLRKCKNLKEVPMDFVNIPTLQLVEVQQCGDSVEESVRRLKEEQLEYGIEDLKVLINH